MEFSYEDLSTKFDSRSEKYNKYVEKEYFDNFKKKH